MTITRARMPHEAVHWSEMIAKEVIDKKKPPYVITSGITTSGPTHLGTVCEFLYPSAIRKAVEETGSSMDFFFYTDILDAFDSVPVIFAEYAKELTPHLGKPLCNVPDPIGCCNSFGEHFVNELAGVAEKMNVHPIILKVNNVYEEGKFDKYALLFLKNFEVTRNAVAVSSQRELPKDWNPIMPICESCGKIATTSVTEFGEDGSYSYTCSKDVGYTKRCGYSGSNKISDHKYKLTWRVHWPSWMDLQNASIEGAGIDHFTKGGSWDSVLAIFNEVFKKEPPIGYHWGFLLFQGKKYSKSAGLGMGAVDLLKLMPPEIIKYFLLRPDIQENKDFDPTGYNLMKLYEDFEYASELDPETELDRADKKKSKAFQLSSTTKERNWKTRFLDVLLYYQIYKDEKKTGELLNDAEGVEYLSKYVRNWVEKGYQPEEYKFEFSPKKPEKITAVAAFANELSEEMGDIDVHNLVFTVAKDQDLKAGELFKQLYTAIIGKEKGPRMGKLIKAIGINKVKETLENLVSK